MKIPIIIAGLVLVGAAAGCSYLVFESVESSVYEACVLSIESRFGTDFASSDIERRIPATDEWRTLTENEERFLFERFAAHKRSFDCPDRFQAYADGTALVGDKGRIKVRKQGSYARVRLEVEDGRTRITNP